MPTMPRRFLPAILGAVVFASGATTLGCAAGAADAVAQWSRYQATFQSAADYENPSQQVNLEVTFEGPNGARQRVRGFWDGGRTWRVRFSPQQAGRWTYRTRSEPADEGLHGRTGAVEVTPYSGTHPLYRHGSLRLSGDHRHLVHADGTPFFWLGDTAWNGVLYADRQGWERYLRDRLDKGFNVIKFVTTQWRAAHGDAEGRVAFTGRERIAITPEFFQRMDERIDAINDAGLIAAPILLWAIRGEENPGYSLPEDQAILLAGYMVARYGAHQVVWLLGGDGDYRGELAERWRRIGRAVFAGRSDRPAAMHPGGRHWIVEEFRDEPWVTFHGYQSGHGDGEDHLRWLTSGPAAKAWQDEVRPFINLEPNYEAHIAYQSKQPIDAHMVRRAAYWSLLVTPPAGVSYGAHGIWSWEREPAVPLNHPNAGVAPAWPDAMALPGSTDMKHLKDLFTSREWWRLRPAPDLLAEQPGTADAARFITAGRADEGRWALVYTPLGGEVKLRRSGPAISAGRWFDPRTGTWSPARPADGGQTDAVTFSTPDGQDWVLLLEFQGAF